MDATIAGLLGVIIGSIASFGGVWLQQRQQSRHEHLKMAVELALHDQEQALELAKSRRGVSHIAPLPSYVIYHLGLLDQLSTGNISPDKIMELSKRHEKIMRAFPGAPTSDE